ncbi:FtsX-like permease family protein [Stenotrophomonas sp. MMGLT7]|uniref:ABC transporter permease n=1 Tax=Stenotrophomonas sp. MMGLT7 TaxID=2901227 RepID=UPI001E3DE007|nr:FtsX-like permease family protein [Stenotrophomonas sp. MMGLT7]MCD7099225.1 FtsX-like permease family protein [Stenotrophomonas sp. MMGLT7]
MHIRPILSALGRHRIATMLIVLEIALACAVLCNAFFLVSTRLGLTRIDSGMDEHSLGTITLSGCDGCNHADLNARVLGAPRAIPGVRAAGTVNALPFGPPAAYAGIHLDREGEHFGGVLHFYLFDSAAIEALDLHPAQGNDFAAGDFQPIDSFVPNDASVWITRSLAEHLWPGENPLGKEFWSGDAHFRVAGVLEHFAVPAPGRSEEGVAGAQWSVIVPVRSDAQSGSYVLRADPLDLPRTMQAAREVVARAVPESVLDQAQSLPLSGLRERYFRSDRAMAWMLVAVIAAMLLVTALGIVGLASFWVAQRTKQIGIRRALGATRGDILRHFQAENFLLATAGIVLGMLLAYAGSLLLMRHSELARLPLAYLPAGAVLLWALGQLAVLGPALRAAAIAPVVATRSA